MSGLFSKKLFKRIMGIQVSLLIGKRREKKILFLGEMITKWFVQLLTSGIECYEEFNDQTNLLFVTLSHDLSNIYQMERFLDFEEIDGEDVKQG